MDVSYSNNFELMEYPTGESTQFKCYRWNMCQAARLKADKQAQESPKGVSDFALKNSSNMQFLCLLITLLLGHPNRQFAPEFFLRPGLQYWNARMEHLHHDSVFKIFRYDNIIPLETTIAYKPDEDMWKSLRGDEEPTTETAIVHIEELLNRINPHWRI